MAGRTLSAFARPYYTAAILAGLLSASSQAQVGQPNVVEVRDSFRSGGATVNLIRFQPPGGGARPAVLMLHGCDGWEQLPAYRLVAGKLVERGYVVALVRYFDRTGTPDAVPPAVRAEFVRWLEGKAARETDSAARRTFDAWVAAVGDAVAYLGRQPNVDRDRIGVLGFSLGGYLAVSAAANNRVPVKAVTEVFGGLPEEVRPTLKALPPALILHGDADDVVPVKEAYALAGLLSHKKLPAEAEIYKGVGHGFIPPGGTQPSPLVVMQALGRTTGFFDRHLKVDSRVTAR